MSNKSKEESYKEMRNFICTGCGKEIMLTKFASQKTCKCDECKANNIPVNPNIVAEALEKNPPKERKSANDTNSITKIRPCIKCGKEVEVSKFMSDQRVICDECKGIDSVANVEKNNVQKLSIDISKLDRSKILPIEEYEVNELYIRNSRLRAVTCPACGHEHMKPNMVIDWSQFGLVISYQCSECLTTMTISEQADKLIKRHSPGTRFDYTGRKIEGIAYSGIEQSRHINIIRKLIKQLDEHNISIDDDEIVSYRWKNDKPIQIGYEVLESDRLLKCLDDTVSILSDGLEMTDNTEYIKISRVSASKLNKEIKSILRGD